MLSRKGIRWKDADGGGWQVRCAATNDMSLDGSPHLYPGSSCKLDQWKTLAFTESLWSRIVCAVNGRLNCRTVLQGNSHQSIVGKAVEQLHKRAVRLGYVYLSELQYSTCISKALPSFVPLA